MNVRFVAMFVVALTCVSAVRADDATDHGSKVSRHWKPSTAVVSPHVPWMNPSADGPLRVLVVQPWQNLREVVELSQRLEITFDVIPVTSVSRNCDETSGMFAYEQEDLAAKLPQAEVLILCGIPPQWFTDVLWQAVLNRIEQGMGLVWTVAVEQHARLDELLASPRMTPDYLRRGAPFSLLQRVDANSVFRCATRGKGRIAAWVAPNMFRTGWTTMTPVTPRAGEEAFYAIVARLARWAGGREPKTQVQLPRPIKVSPGEKVRITATIGTDTAVTGATLIWTVRDAAPLWGFYRATGPASTLQWPRQIGRGSLPVEHTMTQALDLLDGTQQVEWVLPPLPHGAFVADVRLLDQHHRALDWDASTIWVEGGPRIRWLALPEGGIAPDAVVEATVHVDQRDDAPQDMQLVWEATDIDGRALAKGRAPWNHAATQTIAFTLHHALARGVDVQASLVHDGVVISRRTESALVAIKRDTPFRYGVYEPLLARMSDLDVDMLVTGYKGRDEENDLAAFNLDAYHWLNGPSLHNAKSATPVRNPCFNDPDFRAFYGKYLASIEPMMNRQAPIGGLITDEWAFGWDHNAGRPGALHDLCQCDACARLFREFLRKRFGDDLETLNAAWGAAFAGWDDIDMPRLADVPGRFTPAATMSRLRFADHSVAAFFAFANEQAGLHAPSTRLGLSGTRPTDGINGYDYWLLAQSGARSFVHYGGPTVAQTLDLRADDVFVGKWEGYSIWDSSGADAVMWRVFIEGQDALIQYAAFPSYGTHHIDWTLGKGTAAMGRAYREINSGLSRLVRHAPRVRSPVAIHYSPDSFAAAAAGLMPGLDGTKMAKRVDHLHRLLIDAGFDPLFVAAQQIESGALVEHGMRVLVLTDSIAMSDDELAAIEQFQAGGGAVLATSQAALFSQNGRSRASVPTFQPFFMADYGHAEQGGFGGELDNLSGKLEPSARRHVTVQLAKYHVAPSVTITGMDALACRIVTHRDGGAMYYLIWPGPFLNDDREKRPREKVAIAFSKVGHLYDLRARQYMGEVDRVQRTIEEGEPLLFAMLPHIVQGIRIDAASPSRHVGDEVQMSLRVLASDSASDHFIEINVTGPDGKARPAYHRICHVTQGEGHIRIPTALNDETGRWRVDGRDVISGATSSLHFDLVARER